MRLLLALLAMTTPAMAADLPSFLQPGDVFCSGEAQFDAFSHGTGSAQPGCDLVREPTRVAVIGGTGGVKSMVRVISGPAAYQVGWTNGALPLAR